MYNGESSGLGTLFFPAPAWPFFGKLELQKHHSQAGAWERAKTWGEVQVVVVVGVTHTPFWSTWGEAQVVVLDVEFIAG